MARDYRKIGVVLGLCAYALFGAGRAHAQGNAADKAAAEALFDRGLSLMRDGKYQEACERLEQSQAIERGIGTMLYLAECYEKTGRSASAWALFREASSWAQAAGQVERAEAGKRRAERLEKGLSRLTIQVAPASRVEGFELKDNGATVHPSVWGVSVPVDPGVHRIEAKAPGYRGWTGNVKVDDNGGSAEIGVPELERLPNAELAPAPADTAKASVSTSPTRDQAPAKERMSTQRIVGLAVGGAGVAAIAVGAITGGLAIKNNNTSKDRLDGEECGDAKCESDSEKAVSQATISTVMWSVGAALVAGGLVTYFLGRKTQASRTDVALRFDHQSALLGVGGKF
jgi:serine/threonine-protein kinase